MKNCGGVDYLGRNNEQKKRNWKARWMGKREPKTRGNTRRNSNSGEA